MRQVRPATVASALRVRAPGVKHRDDQLRQGFLLFDFAAALREIRELSPDVLQRGPAGRSQTLSVRALALAALLCLF